MRPRISHEEVAYVVEVLTAQINELRQKLNRVELLRLEFARSELELQNLYRDIYEMVAVVECHKQVKV
jgi:prefoldin subunit 5